MGTRGHAARSVRAAEPPARLDTTAGVVPWPRRIRDGQRHALHVSGRFGSGSKTVPGWNVGVGIEAMFNARWSAKAEYLYGGFGNREIFNDNVAGVTVPQHLEVKLNVLRVGLNYRFGY
jgi:opacity protein-like surface antigen